MTGLPEITPGADLAALIAQAALAGPGLLDGDILVITSKIVSKAEDRVVRGDRDVGDHGRDRAGGRPPRPDHDQPDQARPGHGGGRRR